MRTAGKLLCTPCHNAESRAFAHFVSCTFGWRGVMLRSEKKMGVEAELLNQALGHVGFAIILDSSPRMGADEGSEPEEALINLFFIPRSPKTGAAAASV